jgi:transposase
MRSCDTQASPFVALIGIDWADKEHDVAVLDVVSGARTSYRIKQSPDAITDWIYTLRKHYGDGRIAVCLEQSKGPLIYSLMQYGFLTLYPINPRSLKDFRKAFRPSGAKNDVSDARLLLEVLEKHGQWLKAWIPDDEKTRLLGLLVEHRLHAVRERTRLSNRLGAVLKGYFPQALDWAGEKIFSPLACRFLTKWPQLESVKKANDEEVRAFYYANNCRRGDLIEERIQQIRSAIPLTTDQAILSASLLQIRTIIPQIVHLNKMIKEYDSQIKKLFADHEEAFLFRDLPGAGPQLAPRLLTAFGSQRDRFESAEQLQSYSGIAPVTEQSGQTCWIHWRLACPKFLRQTFHEFAAQSTKKSPWAAAYYETQRALGKKHHAAVRNLAFKWIRILYRCWLDRQPYNEERYLKSLEGRHSPLAKLIQNIA